ncbi:MAG: glycosyltransferase family 9 protein [Syntrophaceae bacterium]
MEILIIKLSAIGDVIHTLPSLRALKKKFPGARITWVVESAAADLLKDNPDLDRVIVSDRKAWAGNLKKFKKIKETISEIAAFIRILRDRRYDIVIDFHGLFKSAVLAFMVKGARKLGYDSMQEMSGLFYSEKIPEDMGKHAVDRYLDFPRYLGCIVEKAEFNIYPDAENEKNIDSLFAKNNISSRDLLIAVSPQALWETKLWDNAKFALLCDRIGAELGGKVIFTGGPGGIISGIRSQMKTRSINLEGMTTLRELAALYRRVALLVTTDSGPMHLAAAVNTPVVAVFGPTSPARTGPYGAGHTVIQRDLSCAPCFLKHCETKNCMNEISVEEVLEAIKMRTGNVN